MRDRPALRDVESEQFGELFHSFTGHGVSPGTECGKLIAVLVKWQVAVHHGRNADSTNRCKLLCVFLLEVRFQRWKQVCKPVSASESAYVHTPRVSWFSHVKLPEAIGR